MSLNVCDGSSGSWQTVLQRELRRAAAWERRISITWLERDVGRFNDAVLSAIQCLRFNSSEDDSADRVERLCAKGLNLNYFIAKPAFKWNADLTGKIGRASCRERV